MCSELPLVQKLVSHFNRRSLENHGVALDFDAAYWSPPLVPRMAYDLERRQIQQLGLEAFVSITDHDCIQAPLLLRTLPVARRIPVSVEWTVPYRSTAFHLGIHNLPSGDALQWMERFRSFTHSPSERQLQALLEELDALPQVLVVLNHPIWDLYKIGEAKHLAELELFLAEKNHLLHALELNGLRHAKENREVLHLARRWNQVVISGGDRHGLEPNANINLTNAESFTEFVREVREQRLSHVLFMRQYALRWEQRIMDSTIDAVMDHAHFSPGWKRWDERAFHPDRHGAMRPIAEFWPGSRAPISLRLGIQFVRLLRYRSLARLISLAFPRADGGMLERDVVQESL